MKTIAYLLITLLPCLVHAQDMADFTGGWEGKITHPKSFSFLVEIEQLNSAKAQIKISNHDITINQVFELKNKDRIHVSIVKGLSFEGRWTKDDHTIIGFINSGLLLYQVELYKTKANAYLGTWNPLMVNELNNLNLYLNIENGAGNNYQAYPIFGDNRFTGTWCTNFQKETDSIFFKDFKTGINFKGKLSTKEIDLGIYFGDVMVMQTKLKQSHDDWKIGHVTALKKNLGALQLKEMEALIVADSLSHTHAVLVSKQGHLIYENYFHDYNAQIAHDMRSASKSISSALVGIAKDKSFIESVDQPLFKFLPEFYDSYKDSLNTKIDIKSLLTMSSGLDAIDYGLNANPDSPAVENNYQPTPDWTSTILSAKMINEPNSHANYGSANPYLLGVILDGVVPEPLEFFMDEHLFSKLNISNYIIQTDLTGRPYFGGGMYLTPKDMLKFGELYLNKGIWQGQQILSETWIENSFKNYRPLENISDKNGYGYLWWHHQYNINGATIKSIEARGAGGQYIFVLPQLDVVVVITSGNYRNGKTRQPELILEHYILPQIKS